MMNLRMSIALVVACLGLVGCAGPRGGKAVGNGDEQSPGGAQAIHLEVREEYYPDGAAKRRTEGRIDAEGNFIRHGLLTNYFEDGAKMSELTYIDDIPDGSFTAWYRNGEIRSQGRYVDGREDGVWTVWFQDGRKAQEIPLVRGMWHGAYREWHTNGQLKRQVEWVEGKKQGTETIWDDEGNVALQTEYVDGQAQP